MEPLDFIDDTSSLEEGLQPEAPPAVEAAEEASSGESSMELSLKVVVRPDTLKKIKMLGILSPGTGVAQIMQQLEDQVGHALDALITDELLKQLKTSGMLPDGALSVSDKNQTDHVLSEDEAEESTQSLAEMTPKAIFKGEVSAPSDEVLRPPSARFDNVGDDVDSFLDNVYGNPEPSQQVQMQAMMPYHTGNVSRATKAFNSSRPRASVRAFDGDEESRL